MPNLNSKKKLLIIDDEKDFSDMYEHKFSSEGFFVDKAENGVWGLKKIREGNFDLVLLDMAMPEMNGLEMLKILKEEKSKRNLKIIALSNTALDEEIKQMKENGADLCFIKVNVTPGDVCKEAIKLIKN